MIYSQEKQKLNHTLLHKIFFEELGIVKQYFNFYLAKKSI